jgi:superfamily II DNA or RNA helicase
LRAEVGPVSPVNRQEQAFELRPYQAHTVASTRAAHLGRRRPTGTGKVNRTVNVLATGLGKTVIGSAMAADAHARMERTVVFTHREELADQWVRKLHGACPSASIGIVKGNRNEWEADIVVMSVPSVGTQKQMDRRRIPADRFGLGIADEAHHSAADTWLFGMGFFGAFNGMPWTGFTATLSRGDSRALGDIWSEITADYDIGFGVRNAFLVKPRGIRIRVKDLMLDEVKRSRGDFQDDDLGAAMEDADAGNAIAKAYLEHTPGKRAAMFCPNVSSARRFADDLNEAGIPTEVVVGTTPSEERAAIFERFRLGTTLVISGVSVLTEGWDAPWCEVVIMARPTQSAALYIQCVGRGLRPFKATGKTECVVLDVIGATGQHRLVSLKDLAGKDPDGREFLEDPYDEEEPDELDGEYHAEVKEYNGGELVAEDVDLFADSDSAWLQTDRGVWFVPTKVSLWFLYAQKDGGFTLGRIPAKGGKAHRVERDITMEAGMAWAEKYATDEDPSVSSRNASWRKSRPSIKMTNMAIDHGIPYEGLKQGEVSDMITVASASVVLRKFGARV